MTSTADRVFSLARNGDLNITYRGVSLTPEEGPFVSATWTELREVAESGSANEVEVATRMLDLGWEKEPITVGTATSTNGPTWHITMTGDWTGLSHTGGPVRANAAGAVITRESPPARDTQGTPWPISMNFTWSECEPLKVSSSGCLRVSPLGVFTGTVATCPGLFAMVALMSGLPTA